MKLILLLTLSVPLSSLADVPEDHWKPGDFIRSFTERIVGESKAPEPADPGCLLAPATSPVQARLKHAALMAYLSVISYYAVEDKKGGAPDMERIRKALAFWPGASVEPIEANPVQGFVLKTKGRDPSKDRAFVVIRGSDQGWDWLYNFMPGHNLPPPVEEEQKPRGKPHYQGNVKRQPATAEHQARKGFRTLSEQIHDQILAKVRGFESKKVTFTGHSQGGVLATLLARDFREEHQFGATEVLNYGAPMPGTADVHNSFVNSGTLLHRFVYQRDPVPTVQANPTHRQAGTLVHLRGTTPGKCEIHPEGTVERVVRKLRSLNVLFSQKDHSIVGYYNCLHSLAC